MTKDNTGNTATCGFTVTVEAKYCRPWATVRHGWDVCDPSVDMLVRTLCTFGCFPGYILNGSNTTICEAQDRWSVSSLPTCVPRTCNRLVPGKNNTTIDCTDENKFQSACQYTCSYGFDILPGEARVRKCDAHGNWSGNETVCRDILFQECTLSAAKPGACPPYKCTTRRDRWIRN
ncbi:hypothetical protein DPMN_149632 [Dreissena polymorpha]|uniref:Sushi domain-containing protein n=1 Tax=Dreissena polymorpha TaxID=45954 RepID=A0A9D4FDW4_DREPO|nr:hypothetical protein DPMN_149632 [Dreissena polymorpha]